MNKIKKRNTYIYILYLYIYIIFHLQKAAAAAAQKRLLGWTRGLRRRRPETHFGVCEVCGGVVAAEWRQDVR